MSGNSAGGGSYYTTPERSMRAFDQLPQTARSALAGAVEDWVPQPILTAYRKGDYATGDDIARQIQKWDRTELAKRETDRAKAIGVYRGNVPATAPRVLRRKDRTNG